MVPVNSTSTMTPWRWWFAMYLVTVSSAPTSVPVSASPSVASSSPISIWVSLLLLLLVVAITFVSMLARGKGVRVSKQTMATCALLHHQQLDFINEPFRQIPRGEVIQTCRNVHQEKELVDPQEQDASSSCSETSFPDRCLKNACELLQCVGQWTDSDGHSQKCKRRLKIHRQRGMVCTVHHSFIQCASCSNVIHEGCSQTGQTKPVKGAGSWKCKSCIETVTTEHVTISAIKEQSLKAVESDHTATVVMKTKRVERHAEGTRIISSGRVGYSLGKSNGK